MTHNFCEWVEMGMVFFRYAHSYYIILRERIRLLFVIHQRFKLFFSVSLIKEFSKQFKIIAIHCKCFNNEYSNINKNPC